MGKILLCRDDGEIEAGIRIVLYTENNKLPIKEAHPHLNIHSKSGEISRLVPSKEDRINCALFLIAGHSAKDLGLDIAYATIRPGLCKVFKMLRIQFTELGKAYRHRSNLFLIPIALTSV